MPTPTLSSNHAPGSKHRCVFRASVCTVELPAEEVLVPSDDFTITFHRHVSGQEQVSLVDPQYLPRRHGEGTLWLPGPAAHHPEARGVPLVPAEGSAEGRSRRAREGRPLVLEEAEDAGL